MPSTARCVPNERYCRVTTTPARKEATRPPTANSEGNDERRSEERDSRHEENDSRDGRKEAVEDTACSDLACETVQCLR